MHLTDRDLTVVAGRNASVEYRRFVRDLELGEEFVLAATLKRYKLIEKRRTPGWTGTWYYCKRADTGNVERIEHSRRVIKAEGGVPKL